MQAAREQTLIANWLAVECAGVGLLFSLKQAGEIFAPVPIKPVPYAKPWLAAWPTCAAACSRWWTWPSTWACASRARPRHRRPETPGVAGQRPEPELRAAGGPPGRPAQRRSNCPLAPATAGRCRASPARCARRGRPHWQEIDLEALSRQENFLHIVA
jgi:twitching motility protein PilI